jgi:hypothetical protein
MWNNWNEKEKRTKEIRVKGTARESLSVRKGDPRAVPLAQSAPVFLRPCLLDWMAKARSGKLAQ